MPGTEYTPIDEISELPLLIVPQEESLPYLHGQLPSHLPNGSVLADWNHAYHPSKEVAPIFRSGRVQYVLREVHDEYHCAYYGPPPLRTKVEQFRAIVLSAAGYIPPEGLLLTGDGPQQVGLSAAQRERLRTSGEVKLASFSNIQTYIRETILAQPADHIHAPTIDRFLSLDSSYKDEAREKYRLAYLLTALFIDRLEGHVDEAYNFGRVHRLINPSLPTRPGDFIRGLFFFTETHRKKITQELMTKLTVYRDGPAPRRLGNLALS